MPYPPDGVLPLAPVALLGVLAGCESLVEIARCGEKMLGSLRRLRAFAAGTPSHDQLGDIFATLEAERFQRPFIAWTAAFVGVREDVVAVDGKTLSRSCQETIGQAPIHMISAWTERRNMVLGHAGDHDPTATGAAMTTKCRQVALRTMMRQSNSRR